MLALKLRFWRKLFYCVEESAAPLGLNKCVPMINPGLAPWALNKYRPKGLIARMGVLLDLNGYPVEIGMACIVRYEWVRGGV